jgi:hypothetical protein
MTFGGIPVKIADQSEGWIAVSPDDKQVSFVRCTYQSNDYCSLFVVGNDGHNERRILTQNTSLGRGLATRTSSQLTDYTKLTSFGYTSSYIDFQGDIQAQRIRRRD